MTSSALATTPVRLVLLDVAGTTTPTEFVSSRLLPFARRHMHAWFAAHLETEPGRTVAARLTSEWRAIDATDAGRCESVLDVPTSAAALADYAALQLERGPISSGVQLLAGFVWEQGYESGDLHGEVFPDVPRALRRWRDSQLDVALYSALSELAQRRLFATTAHGDLTPLVSAFFDLTVGSKLDVDSYTRIAASLNRHPGEVLFISDSAPELMAADSAGCQVALCARLGSPPSPPSPLPAVESFDDIL